nr:uncharacterized protein LOC100207300 [Hydra vulgaris]
MDEKLFLKQVGFRTKLFLCAVIIVLLGFNFFMGMINIVLHSIKPNKFYCKNCFESKSYKTISILLFSRYMVLPGEKIKGVTVEQFFNDKNTLPLQKKKLPLYNGTFENNGTWKFSQFVRFNEIQSLKKIISNYDVIIFHVKDMPGRKMLLELSKFRPAHQVWAYFNKESAYNTINVERKNFDGIFNMTITTNRNSHVFAPYGYYEEKKISSSNWLKQYKHLIIFKVTESSDLANKKEQENELLEMDLSFLEKDLPIAWVVSHCNTFRDLYVEKLLQFLPIDVYGSCSLSFKQKKECEKNSYACELRLRRYKFSLAFENSFCEDYITEKYWSAIFRGSIPIVLGGSNYDEKIAIPGSFINAKLFKSPESLANYIRFLLHSEYEYNKYFEWRTKYIVDFKPNDNLRLDRVVSDIRDALQSGFPISKGVPQEDLMVLSQSTAEVHLTTGILLLVLLLVVVDEIKSQIYSLQPSIVNKCCGKVTQLLTDTPFSFTYTICGVTPRQMNDLTKVSAGPENESSYQ